MDVSLTIHRIPQTGQHVLAFDYAAGDMRVRVMLTAEDGEKFANVLDETLREVRRLEKETPPTPDAPESD